MLSCQDAWDGNPVISPDAPAAEGISSLSWLGSPPNYSWPITDEMNGQAYTLADGSPRGAWKAPITVASGQAQQTISITSPSDAKLVLASAADWENNEALREGKVILPQSYTISACEDRAAQFPGMILVSGPACVVIQVSHAASTSSVSVPMYGAKCR